ncbi:MAG: hypothetical protein ACREMY_20540, partial [bacterium]
MTPQVPVSTSIDMKVSIGARRQLIDLVKREHVTTLRVVRAVPPGQWAFRPHPRSQSACDLVWTLVKEQVGAAEVLAGTWT